MRVFSVGFIILCFTLSAWTVSAQLKISWQRCLGGSGDDAANCIVQTTDGGYVVAGSSESYDGDVTGYKGSNSAWVVKLDAQGKIIWENCLSGYEVSSIIETQDGGLAVAGPASYQDSTLPDYHGGGDAWVALLSNSGSLIWQRIYGGTGADDAIQILQTSDSGFAFLGRTASTDGDLRGIPGKGQMWIVKLNDSGTIQWQRRFGEEEGMVVNSFAKTRDGGLVVAGGCNDTAKFISAYNSYFDSWVECFDDTGGLKWQKILRAGADLVSNAIISLPQGGILLAGESVLGLEETDTTRTIPLGGSGWVAKLNDTGEVEWQKYLFETGNDAFYSIALAPDSNFIVAGNDAASERDAWVVMMDDTGGVLWEQTSGGSGEDYAQSIVLTRDGGWIFAGGTNSSDSGVTGWHGDSSTIYYDMWVVKLGGTDAVQPSISSPDPLSIRCYPNPATSEAVLSFVLPQSAVVSISILDDLGRQLQIVPTQEMNAGAHEMTLEVSNWAAGVYECRIIDGGEIALRKLVIIR